MPTNLDVFRLLARRVASEVTMTIEPSTKIHLAVLPKETAWYIEEAIAAGLKEEGFSVVEDAAAPLFAEFGLSKGRVIYSNIRKDGLFGSKRVDRTIELKLTPKIVSRRTGTTVWMGDVEKSATDTIDVFEISNIENPNIPMTKGVVPGEGFFSNIAEPLILLSSIAIAVLLLFNVRS